VDVTENADTTNLERLLSAAPDPDGARARIGPILEAEPSLLDDGELLERLVAIAASSRALSVTAARHPAILGGPDPGWSVTLRLRSALARTAGADMAGLLDMADATERFSEEMDQIVEDRLAEVRTELTTTHPVAADVPFAVIAMGKWGARELNYASDIDLVFVHDPGELDETLARSTANTLAGRLVAGLSAPTFDGPAMVVDADLRPEGAMGPLCRSLDGYTRYYRDWAEPWELQALLKARPAAGDPSLGERFFALSQDLVWSQGLDSDALRSIRRIKEQAESSARPDDVKRSRGGIRDVEFTIQLLQLVHGRLDADLRSARTLDAMEALATHGYIDTEDHSSLRSAYRFLRDLEHRIQFWDLRQTHSLPAAGEDRARIGRSLGLDTDPGSALVDRLSEVKAVVRDIHERLYFRPILDALVGSPTARLGIDQASARLEALGFRDVEGARRALAELTSGLTRRSRVMNQVLPLMLDWLSLSPEPDMGLLQLRSLLAHTPDHSALITLLQTNPLAGERLCALLGTGRLIGSLIDRIPEFIPRLADDRLLADVRVGDDAADRLAQLLESRPEPDARIGTIRRFVRRRKLRLAARDILSEPGVALTIGGLSDTADAAMAGAVMVAEHGPASGVAVVAMGKWGGRELSYESDLDLMYVYADDEQRESALEATVELDRILAEPSKHGEAYQLDAGLRPEGKNGPMARSLEGYQRYYAEWAEPWEVLALVRARPVAGDPDTIDGFADLITPVVWRQTLPAAMVRSIRAIKARVETERIPADQDPDFHLKLGKGSLSDVEFLTQLLQLQHGGSVPELRVTGTLEALERLHASGLLNADEHAALSGSYEFCTRVRLRLHLQQGRVVDSLPSAPHALSAAAVSLGYDRASDLREDYRRLTRRARRVFERRFY
jgi:glutamate-ammonia-ligase adenylyltransferase